MMGAAIVLGIMPQVVRRLIAATELAALQAIPGPSDVARAMSDILIRGIGVGTDPTLKAMYAARSAGER
jgi:hypothetical protein